MLGNWSLGDYFKREQLPQVWTFLTERVGLDPNRIYVTLLHRRRGNGIPKDTEAAGIWTELFDAAGVSADQVELGSGGARRRGRQPAAPGSRSTSKKNWWCRGGKAEDMPVGEPGGPDSEMFYLYPQIEHDPAYGAQCHQNCDCGRYIEIGNSVFMEYEQDRDRASSRCRGKNVDFGGGLARIAAASMDSPRRVPDQPAMADRRAPAEAVRAELRGRHGGHAGDRRPPARRGVPGRRRRRPSNKTQGYVMRRLVRRADPVRLRPRAATEDFFPEIVPTVATMYHDDYPEVDENAGDG